MPSRPLIFIVAYKAEPYIKDVIDRSIAALQQIPDCAPALLVIDDSSPDNTEKAAREALAASPFPWEVLRTPRNQQYGGNQKLGYSYAIREQFDYVLLMHGDGQYSPDYIPAMLAPLMEGSADVVLGSRMVERKNALKGGMPLHKYCGNIALTWIQNKLLHTRLAEFHTGLRAFRVSSLAQIPFNANDDGFSFDTEILIQLIDQQQRLAEIPIMTRYGDEISHVNTVLYSKEVVTATLLSRLQRFGWAQRPSYSYSPLPVHPDRQKLSLLETMRLAAKQYTP